MPTENPTTPPARSPIQLYILVPCIILAGIVADVGLRFLPPNLVTFRAWEAAALFVTTDGPFASNFTYRNDRSYGDLANLGNMPSLRLYRPQVFTTDAFGFRRTPGAEGKPVKVIVFGDSFMAGAGLSDEDTFSAQLARLGGFGVYNGGGVFGDGSWTTIESLIKRLDLKNGVILYEHSERFEIPTQVKSESPEPGLKEKLLQRLLGPDSTLYHRLQAANRDFFYRRLFSPVKIEFRRGFRVLQNDVILPNVAARNVVRKELTDGQPMLFLESEIENFSRPRTPNIDFFVRLNSLVKASGNHLLVMFVPDKYNVYYSLLRDPTGEPVKEPYLRRLAQELTDAEVPALDLTPILREQATAAFARGEYTYLIDDTHWNPLGVERAAEAALEALPLSPEPD